MDKRFLILLLTYELYLHVLLLHVSSAQRVNATAEPDTIIKGLTDSLKVNCTFDSDSKYSLVTLKVSYTEKTEVIGQGGYTELASINSFSPQVPASQSGANFTSSSAFSSSGLSFLSLEWRDGDIKRGAYRCEASGVDETGHPFNVADSSFVSGVSSESQLLAGEIVKLRNEVVRQGAEFQSSKEYVWHVLASWDKKLNLTRRSIFIESAAFNGSVYYLSRANFFDNTGIAQAVCEVYNSSLAEIESDAELEYVQTFVANNTDLYYFYYIVIGGVNNGGVNGTWVSPSTSLPLGYLSWAQGYPTRDTYATCLGLWSYVDWKMVNLNCFKEPLDWPKKFLCELPIEV